MQRRRSKQVAHALLAVLLACFAGAGATFAQATDLATSSHAIRLDGKSLKYTAYAGRLPIRDQATGESHGEMFFTAYRVASKTPRPVAFIWNGGPGAASTLLHFEAFGPRTFSGADLNDNPNTLLGAADLVFVDPIGTGFSRPTKKEYEAEFYNTLGDHASMAEFIRIWRQRFDARGPVWLMGESFGTWRAAGVAEIMEKRGDHVAGIVLISGGAGVGTGYDTRESKAAARIPGRTAAALHHGKLDASLGTNRDVAMKSAEDWALRTYAPALARLDQLPDAERESVARDLERYTGLAAGTIDRKTLQISPRDYLRTLLKEQNRTLNTFDMRIAGGGGDGEGAGQRARMSAYFRHDLGYKTDITYAGLEEGYTPTGSQRTNINGRWNYNSGEITPEVMAAAQAGEGPPGSLPWAVNAVKLNSKLKVVVAAGFYDSLNSCAGNNELKKKLEPAVAPAFSMLCYAGGHMMYRDEAEGVRLTKEIVALMKN